MEFDRPDFSSAKSRSSAIAVPTTRASVQEYKPTIPAAVFQQLFSFTIPRTGSLLLVGAPSSGIQEFLNLFPDAARLRGGQFANSEAYNTVLGASVGYVGSDTPTRFLKLLSENPDLPIIIDGISTGSSAQINDFVSQLRDGTLQDKTGTLGEIDTTNRLIIFTAYEDITLDTAVSAEIFKEKLSKVYKADGTQAIPEDLLDYTDIAHFHTLTSRPNSLLTSLSVLRSPTPTRLKEAALLFSLTNRDLFQIGSSPVQLQREGELQRLLVSASEFRVSRTLGKESFLRFEDELHDYLGQTEAVDIFQNALALKIQQPTDRPSSLFCVGPPGVGKTELAKALGKALHGFCRIDSNVVTSTHDLFGSLGSPGLLTKSLVKGEPSVILFDEIEKMPTEAVLGLLQLLDEGRLYDAYLKETWPLSECVIVFTSNAIRDANISSDDARELLKHRFPEEFIDRLDFVVPFRKFTTEQKLQIARNLASKRGLTLSDSELDRVASPESIRQLQLELQNIQAKRARDSLRRR